MTYVNYPTGSDDSELPKISYEDSKMEKIMDGVDKKISGSMVTCQFGDNWKEYAMANLTIEQIINIAWMQGRKSVALQEVIKTLL